MKFMNLKDILLRQFNGLDPTKINELINSLKIVCEKNNSDLSNLHFVDYGESSVVFELNNQIIKLTFNEYDKHPSMKEYVSHSSKILQPNFEQIIDDVKLWGYTAKILGFKKLSLDNITDEDVLNMYVDLRDDGYLWYDTKKENIGKDADGKCYLIDYGELIYINDLDNYNLNKELETHRIVKNELDSYYSSIKENNQYKTR